MSDNNNSTREIPTYTVKGYDEKGNPIIVGDDSTYPVVVGHSDKSDFIIPEPPITLEDTRYVRTVAVPESWLREWQETFSYIGQALKGIGWDSTVDTLTRIGDQIDKALGARGSDHE